MHGGGLSHWLAFAKIGKFELKSGNGGNESSSHEEMRSRGWNECGPEDDVSYQG